MKVDAQYVINFPASVFSNLKMQPISGIMRLLFDKAAYFY